MVTTRNMTVEDPTEAIKMLQQQMEDMRRQYEAELLAMREEYVARIAQERTAQDKGKEKAIGDREAEREDAQTRTCPDGQAKHSSASD